MRFGYSIATIVVWAGAILATVTAGVLVALQLATVEQPSNLTGRVQIGADSCQSFVIDHKTGFISNDQRATCGEAAKESKTAKESKRKGAKEPVPAPEQTDPRYPNGARIEAIRDSFYKR